MRIQLIVAAALALAVSACGGSPPTPKAVSNESQQMCGLASSIHSQISKCINPPKSAAQTIVRVKINFAKDGTLVNPPETLQPLETPEFKATEAAVKAAVVACAPYELPPELYDRWRTVVLAINPNPLLPQ